MDMLRAVQIEATITQPDVSNDRFPAFQICEGANDVTLKKKDFGRACVVYDVGELFNKESHAEPSAEAWKGVLRVVLEAWGIAEAAALHPDHLNRWTNCSKKSIQRLRNWSYIRAAKRYPPTGTTPGILATESELAWASKPFNDF